MIIPFVKLYTRGADINYIYPLFSVIFVLSSAFYILKMPSNSLINISGRFKETRWRAILEAFLTVFLGIAFTYWTGLNGVVIGTGVALCWRCIDTIVYTNKYVLACTNYKSLFRLFRVIVIVVLCAVIRNHISVIVNSYLDWVKWSIIFSLIIIFFIVINSLLFDFKTIKELIDIFRKRKL